VGGLEALGLDQIDPEAPPVRLEGSSALAATSPEVGLGGERCLGVELEQA
jgi:hypothetical protein